MDDLCPRGTSSSEFDLCESVTSFVHTISTKLDSTWCIILLSQWTFNYVNWTRTTDPEAPARKFPIQTVNIEDSTVDIENYTTGLW